MTTSHTRSFDDLLKRGLARRAAGETGDLLELIVRAAEASPQRRTLAWQMLAGSRRLVALAVITMLLVALAAAAAIAFRPPRPLPAFVPHANGEIVTQGDGCALIALDPSTGEQRPMFAGIPACFPKGSTYELAWDPTGNRLALGYWYFCGGCVSEEAGAAIAAQVSGLWVFDATRSQLRQLVYYPATGALTEVRWSADGSRIAYVGPDHQVWVIPSGGGEATLVSDSWPAGVHGPPAWSPDSSTVAYADDGPSGPRVVVAPLGGGGRSTLFETAGETIDGITWAPDGRSILVTTGTDVGGAIRIVHADGSGARLVLSLSDGPGPVHAHWSPDGSRIAFKRIVETMDSYDDDITLTVAEVWTMAADGGDRRLLFEASSPLLTMSDVAWSPDGRYLIFSVTEPNGSTEEYGPYVSSGIYVAADDGSGVRRLRYAPFWDSWGFPSVAWRPVP